jgi:signal transduction histidine kinase
MDLPAASDVHERTPTLTALRRAVRDMPLDPEGVVEVTLNTMKELGYERAALFALDPSGTELEPISARGDRFDADAAVAEVVGTGDPAFVVDVSAAPVWGDGWLVGILAGHGSASGSHGAGDLDVLALLASATGAALQNAQRFELERQAVERMDRLDRLKSDFLSTVSHELRTPLTAIQGMGLTLERSWADLDDETRSGFLRSINDRAAALGSLVEQLLDVSDLDTARSRLHTEPIDITELLAVAGDRFTNEHQRHALQRAVAPSLSAVGDAALIARVVDQLLSNAGKHTPPGTTVTLSATLHDGAVSIEIADGGPGLAPDDLELAGERFHRGGDLNTRPTGLGLGLALVDEILTVHGARLEVESQPGSGASFRFELPAAR